MTSGRPILDLLPPTFRVCLRTGHLQYSPRLCLPADVCPYFISSAFWVSSHYTSTLLLSHDQSFLPSRRWLLLSMHVSVPWCWSTCINVFVVHGFYMGTCAVQQSRQACRVNYSSLLLYTPRVSQAESPFGTSLRPCLPPSRPYPWIDRVALGGASRRYSSQYSPIHDIPFRRTWQWQPHNVHLAQNLTNCLPLALSLLSTCIGLSHLQPNLSRAPFGPMLSRGWRRSRKSIGRIVCERAAGTGSDSGDIGLGSH